MNLPAEDRVPPDPGGPIPPDDRTPDEACPEARIPAVVAAVLATWVLIAVWRALRHMVG